MCENIKVEVILTNLEGLGYGDLKCCRREGVVVDDKKLDICRIFLFFYGKRL